MSGPLGLDADLGRRSTTFSAVGEGGDGSAFDGHEKAGTTPNMTVNDIMGGAVANRFTPDPDVLEANHIVAFDSRDLRSRPFNLMRTRFMKQLELQKMRMVGITSPAPTAGKSLLSINLAAAIARLKDVPVILADLDLRRGSVAETLGMTVNSGVTRYLEGTSGSIEESLVSVEGLPLVVLPAKPTTGDSSVLLSGDHYANLMRWLRAQAETAIVIVDLPPVFANDDAMILMESLDGYVMVVESGKTTARQVRDAIDLLKPAVPLGTVLNRYKGGVLDSYGYGSGGAYSRYYDHS
ncbi:CpsD/CapB family tyrosine-protein kinase [Porphyrobacter sp. GA68]|uniref:CpsD/CapB family tyrosine-protein kinase n=1 Tax=Porphyrobacter sp. GA68 TaxID=2883480 RepID=UPI001D188A5B|nr:CpsD/CapB family tyrosine-protein kinase [Porphyrobacter sp. GA68]